MTESVNKLMLPPPMGVANLAAAKKVLLGSNVSSSHVNDAIIKTHSAIEIIFRQYLSEMLFIPSETRSRAANFSQMNFPELIRAMNAHGQPSLRDLEEEVSMLNQIRNTYAHGVDDRRVSRQRATAFIKMAEDIYKKYSQYKTAQTSVGKKTIMNPFVKEFLKAGLATSYSSDDYNRVVWLKGLKAKVPEKGELLCPIWKYDTVAFVWMHAVQVPMGFSSIRFISSDSVDIEAEVELSMRVKDSDIALINVATRFEDALDLLKAEIASIVRGFCRSRSATSLVGREAELQLEILRQAPSSVASSTFEILKVSLELRVPIIENAASESVVHDLAFERDQKNADRENALLKIKNIRNLDELKATLELESKRAEADCLKEQLKAGAAIKSEEARLEYINKISEITDASKTAILHIAPDLYRDLELAKIANSSGNRLEARSEIIELLNALAAVSKNAAPVSGIINANISNDK